MEVDLYRARAMQRLIHLIRWSVGIATIPVFVATNTSADTRLVPAEYSTINAALDACAFGDTVLVAPGTYTDSEERGVGFTHRSCAFMVDGVVLRSEAGPTVTTIDMKGASGQQSAVVEMVALPSLGTAIEGFTITGAPLSGGGAWVVGSGLVTFRDCLFRDMDAGGSTGAGLAANGDVDVIDCEFVNCVANSGGAIYHSNGHLNLLRTTIRECGSRGALLAGNAGGPGESALIEDCVFLDNWSYGTSGGLAISRYNLGATVRRCRFEGNVSYGSGGGGMTFTGFGPKLIEDCLFLNNSTSTSNGQGGALKVSGNSSCTIRGNTFQGNSQTYEFFGGAAVYIAAWTFFQRNVISESSGNTAVFVNEGQGGHLGSSCNVYWANADGNGVPLDETDREVDPQFCDVGEADFTVHQGSPCVEPGSLGCGQIGAFGVGCGTISILPTTWGRLKAEFREGGE